MVSDPYATLGVARDASTEDIKRAYRRLSKEWHPDKHPSTGSGQARKEAEERFKGINEAYEILSDPQRKQMFDQFGSTDGFRGGPSFGGFDFSGFTTGIPDLGDLFEGFFSGRARGAPAREEGADQQVEVMIDLADVLLGTEQTVQLRTQDRCSTCGGSGVAPGGRMVTCAECGGTGQVVRTAQSFFGTMQQRTVCSACAGSGKVPSEGCTACHGEGRTAKRRDVRIRIPAGIGDGQTLRIRGEGEAGRRSAPSGDLYVTVRVRPDPRFERDGADVRSSITIPVIDAILGADAEVDTVQGRITLAVPESTQPGQVLRIKGKGLPVLGTGRHGDHYVTVHVDIPRKLSRAERKLLEEWRRLRV